MSADKTPPHEFRIEHRYPASNSLLPDSDFQHLYADPSLAVAVAVKSVTDPSIQEVRVVHIPTGEIVFETAAARKAGN